MDGGSWVLLTVAVGYAVAAAIRYLRTRRRPVTLSDTLLARVIHSLH